MKLFDEIGHVFVEIGAKIAGVFSFLDKHQVVQVLQKDIALWQSAMPFVQQLADALSAGIGNPLPSEIARAVTAIGFPVEKLFEEGLTGLEKFAQRDGKLSTVVEMLRSHLQDQLQSGHDVQIGPVVLHTLQDLAGIDNDTLRTAVQNAYLIFDKGQKANNQSMVSATPASTPTDTPTKSPS